MTIRVRTEGGSIDIVPFAPGQEQTTKQTSNTRLRVPQMVHIDVEPTGDEVDLTVVPVKVVTILDRSDAVGPYRTVGVKDASGQPVELVWLGDWRYAVVHLALDTLAVAPRTTQEAAVKPRTAITTASLTALRLPALLQRALRPQVALVDEDGAYVTGSQDPDDKAVVEYLIAQMVSGNPTTAVAEALGVNPNAAAQRVHRLRKVGRLPAAKRGR